MQQLKCFSILLLLALCVISCGKDNEEGTPGPSETLKSFNFDDLTVGQTFRYSLFFGNDYFTPGENDMFYYSGDTLQLEITEVNEYGVKIKESILPTSAMFIDLHNYYGLNKEAVYENQWVVSNDSLMIYMSDDMSHTPKSHLFRLPSAGNNVKLPLNVNTSEEIEIDGWKTSVSPYTDDGNYFVDDLELLGNVYDYLNVAVRHSFMNVDGPGHTYVYNKEFGFVRVVEINPWFGSGVGWDRID